MLQRGDLGGWAGPPGPLDPCAALRRPPAGTSSTWCSSVTRLCWDLVSVSFSSVLILNPSASPVWLPCEGGRGGSPLAWWRGGVGGLGAVAGWLLSTHVVEKVPDFQDQLAEDRQPATGEQACGIRSLHAPPRPGPQAPPRVGQGRGARGRGRTVEP